MNHLKFAVRQLLKNPGFASSELRMFAPGSEANAAILRMRAGRIDRRREQRDSEGRS